MGHPKMESNILNVLQDMGYTYLWQRSLWSNAAVPHRSQDHHSEAVASDVLCDPVYFVGTTFIASVVWVLKELQYWDKCYMFGTYYIAEKYIVLVVSWHIACSKNTPNAYLYLSIADVVLCCTKIEFVYQTHSNVTNKHNKSSPTN